MPILPPAYLHHRPAQHEAVEGGGSRPDCCPTGLSILTLVHNAQTKLSSFDLHK